MSSGSRSNRVLCQIPIRELRELIVGKHIRIATEQQIFSFYIGPFVEKYLTCKACAGCGLAIRYAKVMRIEKSSRAKLYFFGERDGKPIQFTKDHCIPLARGGTNVEDNIQAMCSECNTFKGDSLSMSPLMWIMRKRIEFDATVSRYNELFSSSSINQETYTRRMEHVGITYANMKRRAKVLFNIAI